MLGQPVEHRQPQRVALLIFLICAWGAPGWAMPPTSAHPVPKYALVIGNAHYSAVGTLKNPANDAQDMCAALKSIGYETACFIDVDTRAHLRALIQDFVERVPEEAVTLVYYAGHAVQIGGENYLIPAGAHITDQAALARESVALSFLMGQLRRTDGYLSVVILDACRNNPLTSGDSLPQGLAQITDVPDGTEVLYATAANEPALDGVGRNGTLTKYLLAHLHDAGTIDDLFKQVSLGVQRETQALGSIQKPALYTNFTGQYCFVRCTDLELLQRQRQEAAQKITELEARVSAGDTGARADLAAAVAANAKLLEQIRKQDAQEKQAAKDRQDKAFVPPAF
jgi:uncharacterized caspase-like protein